MAIRDFDEDGDLDIATVSFYPDYSRRPNEAFIYFENEGGRELCYHPRTFAESDLGRWMTLDAGDVDRDGDIDLVLASQFEGPSLAPAQLESKWVSEGPPYVILRNALR